jgi:serine/threonine-protein kinase
MAPEQASCGPVDRRTDVFAMGVVLWEALSGKRLFVGDDEVETLASVLRCAVPPLRRVAPDVPRALARIVDRALDRDPRARFWTALEMKQALESAMADARVQVHAPEVAATLAELLPDRVREHERWPETVRTAATRTRRAPQAPQGGVPLAIGALLTALAVVAIAIPSLLVMWKLRHPPAMQPVAAALPR